MPNVEPVRLGSLEQAVSYLAGWPDGALGRVFVIGGAQIYGAALRLREKQVGAVVRRILLTRVMTDYECDVFFPLELGGDEREISSVETGEEVWRRCPKEDLDAWVGESVPDGIQDENDTRYEFQMWEKIIA
jgi:dihydrofolate reductase